MLLLRAETEAPLLPTTTEIALAALGVLVLLALVFLVWRAVRRSRR